MTAAEAIEVAAEEAPTTGPPATTSMPKSVGFFVSFVLLATVALAAVLQFYGPEYHWHSWLLMVVFVVLVVTAERLDVRFRLHGQVETLNLSEAVIAPLIFAFGGPVVMAVVACAQVVAGCVRSNDRIKILFNASQWAFATGVGSVVYETLRAGSFGSRILAMLGAMVAVGIVNQFALATVLRLAQRKSARHLLTSMAQVVIPGWVLGWALNTLVGLLFVLAFATSAFATCLFFIPLGVLHAAYRGYAGMESDRMRLAGLHRASRKLTERAELDNAMAGFLAEVCRCFEAQTAALFLKRMDGLVVYEVEGGDPRTYARKRVELSDVEDMGLYREMISVTETTRSRANEESPLAVELRSLGHRDCLVSPLPSRDTLSGALAVFDQNGLEGFEEGEHAVIEALTRETTSSIERGRLFAAVVEERHKLSQILDNTYDGVLTLTADGVVSSWNPGWEQIAGFSAFNAVGRHLSETISLTDPEGFPVDLDSWANSQGLLPKDVQLIGRDGTTRWLECSYRVEVDESGAAGVLAVIAHDVTDLRENEQLRVDNDRLAELEAEQRGKVLQLQESLQPDIPQIAEGEFGVHYEPSDRTAPTGGDFYDWQLMSSGDIHIAVVDVLGHGIEATNDALALIHTLRTLAFQGTPVEHLIGEADAILASLDTELVATAICARYRPSTGECRLAGGGHPPPLLVRPDGTVDEVAAPGVPVGWPGAGSDNAVDITLVPQDTLVFYTDGLVEAQRDILLGLEALAGHARNARALPAQALARTLVEKSLEGADRRDDSLALVVRHTVAVRNNEGFGFRAAPHADEVTRMRHNFTEWMLACGFERELGDDLTIAITELASNAVRVGIKYFEVRAAVVSDGILIEVEDDGPGLDVDDILAMVPDPESESGRGLLIVRSLVDEFSVRSTGHGTVIRARKLGHPIPIPDASSRKRSSV